MTSMREGTADTPSARAARDSALRSLTKPTKRGFSRALLRSINEVGVYSPSGIYLRQGLSYHVDLDRLCRVIERTTRGLYFHEYGGRLPEGHRCKTYAIDGFGAVGPKGITKLRELWAHAVSGTRRDFGQNVWAFVVYEYVPFFAFTGPMAQPDPSTY
jgi:hypothetical protein